MPRLIPALAIAVTVGIAGCMSPAGSVEPSAASSVGPSPRPGAGACPALDLRDPAGARIILTGTWREPGGGPVYYLFQGGECLWYVGGFAASDGEQAWGPFGMFTITYQGRVAADFRIVGRWAVVRTAGNSFLRNDWHDKTWTVEFESSSDGYDIVLTSLPDENGAFTATRLEKLSDNVVAP